MSDCNGQAKKRFTALKQTMPQATPKYLVCPYSPRQRLVLYFLAIVWLFALISFYYWWFDPAHLVTPFGFWIITGALFYDSLIPVYFIYFVLRARVPNPIHRIPSGWRVAMVVTKVPSEPLSMVKATLEGMLSQQYPHDVWLADEDPSSETIAWCKQKGIKISCRKNVTEYHQSDWPRRTRCKEGNLAYFYDKFGYENYDFVVQMDADHVPQPGYLEEMLRPFEDSGVGYVSAPSICDVNADASWPARARLYAEGHLHGVQQMGHSNGFAPLCFGSHYAVRTAALKEIGGLGPELAEDHSTTLMMNSAGWRGVHAASAVARGLGPDTFPDFAIQEFQWARSLTVICLVYTPRYWRSLSWKHKLQFGFSQLWYPLFSLSMLFYLLLPAAALYSHTPLVNVVYLEFLWRSTLVILPLLLINLYLIRIGFARPRSARTVSWEAFLFMFVRWPWSLLGCAMGILDFLRGRPAPFKITPKSKQGGQTRMAPQFSLPYLALSIFAIAPVFMVREPGASSGYVIFSVANALIYAVVFALVSLEITWTKEPQSEEVGA